MRKFLIAGAVVALFAGSACGGDKKESSTPTTSTGKAPAAVIKATGTTWEPDEVSIAVGDVVKFDIEGSVVHDLKGDEGLFHKASSKFVVEKQFDKAGTFSYQCTIHPGMTGTIEVK